MIIVSLGESRNAHLGSCSAVCGSTLTPATLLHTLQGAGQKVWKQVCYCKEALKMLQVSAPMGHFTLHNVKDGDDCAGQGVACRVCPRKQFKKGVLDQFNGS